MTYIDHMTFVVPDVTDPMVRELMVVCLGLEEFQADEQYEAAFMRGQFVARWFRVPGKQSVMADMHVVEGNVVEDWDLQHVCVRGVGQAQFELCRDHPLCTRRVNPERVWLTGPGGIRVEVQA